MSAILISGVVALGLAGDYLYFGAVGATMEVRQAIVAAPVAGILGGVGGGLFARLVLGAATAEFRWMRGLRGRPILFAFLCGCVVAAIGVTTGLTWGPGYLPAHAIVIGVDAPFWFGFAKFATTAATAIAGLPGGIFAPSLAAGAGFGNMLRWLFPNDPASAVVLLGMVAYFTGVVRAPLTAVFILTEATASRGLMFPMMAAALVADQSSQWVCREKLYHGLSRTFSTRADDARPAARERQVSACGGPRLAKKEGHDPQGFRGSCPERAGAHSAPARSSSRGKVWRDDREDRVRGGNRLFFGSPRAWERYHLAWEPRDAAHRYWFLCSYGLIFS
jgi:H+/Cl- antiporter ClcA